MSSEPTAAAATSAACASCGQSLDGRYCSRCGEERLDRGKLTVWHFVTDTLVPEIVNLDGKIWRTLRLLLFRPAFLALEYAAGRRRLYVKPLRVLLTAIVVYALGTPSGLSFSIGIPGLEAIRLSVAPVPAPKTRSIEGTLDQVDRFGVLERMFTRKVGPAESATTELRERFNGMLNGVATPLSFATVVLLALALYACFHRRRPLFVEHAVFSMHYFSFVLITSLLDVIGVKIGLTSSAVAIIALILSVTLWQFTYLAAAIRRFYLADARRLLALPTAAALAFLLYVLNSFFITAIQMTAAAIAIWRL